MSLGLLLPAGLLGLVAMLVPVLLHLVRQSEQKRVEFAALRWLTARAQPRRRPRLDEWLLLLLRLLLLALLALWLAQPAWLGPKDTRPWLLVHPAIAAARAPPSSHPDEQRRWLAPGFPSLEQPAPTSTASIGSLLRELDASLPVDAAVRVLVPAQFDATDAERPVLQRKVQWTAVPGLNALAKMDLQATMQMAVHVDPAHRGALPYLRAASAAWAARSPPTRKPAPIREMAVGKAPRRGDTHVFWLAAGPVPTSIAAWVGSGGVALLAHDSDVATDWSKASVAWRGSDGAALAQRLHDGKGAWIKLLAPLDPQSLPALLEPDFPHALQDLLATAPPTATRAMAPAYAPVKGSTAAATPQAPSPLGPWLASLVALLFGLERWLAASPRRVRA